MLNRVIDAALRNRFLVLVACAAAAAAGAAALLDLDIDAFPDVTPVQVQVNTTAPALGPEEVERQITFPLEQGLGGLPRLTQLRSISKFGLSQVIVLFEDGTDIYFARQLVAERLAAVQLPPGIDRPKLGPPSTGLGEIFHYTLALKDWDFARASPAERVEKLAYLRTIHDWTLKPQLRTVPGVAEVNAWGGYEKQYQVRPDPARMSARGVTFAGLADALGKGNANAGGGGVSRNGEFVLVQGIARAASAADVGEILVGARGGVPVRVRDVADVGVGNELRRGSVTAHGRGEAVLGLAFLTVGENSKVVTAALRKKLDGARSSLPADVELTIVYDRTELVDVVIDTVRRNLFEGGLMVVAVLFAFLGNLRAAAIVAVAIPLSMLFAFAGMWKFGIAASLLSLGAIDFGMVVDSSVVMIENCVRHLGHAGTDSRTKREIVRDAAVEVRRPTLFGELVILVVYLPILTLEGTSGKLFRPMALTVIFALLGSMLLSLTLMPVLASYALPRARGERMPLLMRVAETLYRPLLHLTTRFKLAVGLFAAAILAFTFGLVAPSLGTEFVPKLSEGAIALNVIRLAGTDLSGSNEVNTRMERMILAAYPDEVKFVWSRVGSAEVATDPMGIELTDMYIMLHPRGKWTKAATQDELTEQLEKLIRPIPGQKVTFEQPIEMRISEMETGIRADVGVKLYGDDFPTLVKKAAEIEAILKAVPGAADVTAEQVTGQPVVQIRVDADAAGRAGVAPQTVLDAVRAVGSFAAGEVVEGQLRFPLVLKWPAAFTATPAALGTIPVDAPGGEKIPLARLATITQTEGPATITRDSGRRRITITANVRGRDVGGFAAEAKRKVAAVPLPPGRYHVEWGGEFENYARARKRLLIVVPVAVLLIFGLLFATYNNAADALRVLTGVPFGCVGGVLALWLRDMPFSVSAAVGFIALSGVAVLDDMILVSYVRQLRRKGVPVADALEAAAVHRLRPVLMTTLVAAVGFLPMAVSTGQGAEVQRPLATVVIGGVISAMVMSLFVLRVMYLVFDAAFRGVYWVLTRVVRVSPAAAAGLLGLDDSLPENGDDHEVA